MIVTCPSCSARYKINESKIKGRGAKITCPRCSHRFVVYREEKPSTPDDVSRLDFGGVGITWRVRKGLGVHYDFFDLSTLQDFIEDGQVNQWDKLTYDHRNWVTLDSIDDLEAYFWDIYQKARRGEISIAAPSDEDDDEELEDDSDAPTQLVGQQTSLAGEIRKALDVFTPEPSPPRDEPIPAPAPPPPAPTPDDYASEPQDAEATEEVSQAAPLSPRQTGAIAAAPLRIDPDEERRRRGELPAEPAEPAPAPPAEPETERPPPSPKKQSSGWKGPIVLLGLALLVLVPVLLYALDLIPAQTEPEPVTPTQPSNIFDKAKGNKAKGNKAKGNKAKGNKAKGNKAKGNKAKGNKAKAKPTPAPKVQPEPAVPKPKTKPTPTATPAPAPKPVTPAPEPAAAPAPKPAAPAPEPAAAPTPKPAAPAPATPSPAPAPKPSAPAPPKEPAPAPPPTPPIGG